MMRLYVLGLGVFALGLSAFDAQAFGGLFRRNSGHTPAQPTYLYPAPTVVPSGASETSPSADNLSAAEKTQLQEMINAGWFSDEAEVEKYTAANAAERKDQFETFKKETAAPTSAELDQFVEMVKAGRFKVSELAGYAGAKVSERKEVYDEFKKTGVTVAVTADELAQFLEMVKAAKESKGGLDLIDFTTYQKFSPAQRKALYEASKK